MAYIDYRGCMFLDLRDILRKGKEQENFFFEYTITEDLVSIPSAEIENPVRVSGNITLNDRHSAYITGEVAFTLSGDCTRCLTKTSKTLIAEFDEFVTINNEDGYSIVNDRIDLSKIVNDVIVSSMPVQFLCSENCKGICLGCGVNLNNGECKCKN